MVLYYRSVHFQVYSSLPKNIRRIESIYGNFSIWQKLKKIMKKSLIFYTHVGYICYVEGCKFSTSTHVNYRIVQNIISAICGYFYGFWEPKITSEIAYIDQNGLKMCKPCPAPPLGQWNARYIYSFLGHFLLYRRFLSDQEVPRGHKNIHRQLR